MQERKSLSVRAYDWLDDRFDLTPIIEPFATHPVPKHARTWPFCLGGLTFMFFTIQAITGVLLALYYKPTPDEAYTSVVFIMNQVRFGWLIRSLHFWGANLMIATVILHMLRIYIMGAYKPPRELNWVVGMFALFMTLGLGFTGYLLPWDQLAYWATTVGTEIAASVPLVGGVLSELLKGGPEISDVTLTRFYGIHMLVLPASLIGMLAGHFFMVRRQGISGPL